jgi:hypothetical protein
MDQGIEAAITMSRAYFQLNPVTPDTIRGFINHVKAFFAKPDFDEIELFNRLESIYAVVVRDKEKTLENKDGHEDWFNPDTNQLLKGEFKWHFWDHYEQYLMLRKG